MTDTTKEVWRRQFDDACQAIPAQAIGTFSDGFVGIKPEYSKHLSVEIYYRLLLTGIAKGWI